MRKYLDFLNNRRNRIFDQAELKLGSKIILSEPLRLPYSTVERVDCLPEGFFEEDTDSSQDYTKIEQERAVFDVVKIVLEFLGGVSHSHAPAEIQLMLDLRPAG